MAGTRAQGLKADVRRFPDGARDIAIDSQPGFAVGGYLLADGTRLYESSAQG